MFIFPNGAYYETTLELVNGEHTMVIGQKILYALVCVSEYRTVKWRKDEIIVIGKEMKLSKKLLW